jgi:hypothetical protein
MHRCWERAVVVETDGYSVDMEESLLESASSYEMSRCQLERYLITREARCRDSGEVSAVGDVEILRHDGLDHQDQERHL